MITLRRTPAKRTQQLALLYNYCLHLAVKAMHLVMITCL